MSVSQRVRKVTDAAYHHALGQRTAAWLRQRHPVGTAKRVAIEVDVAEITARKWLAGRCPSVAHLSKMMALWGGSFASYVLQPLGSWTEPLRVAAEIDALEAALDAADERAARAREDLAALKTELGNAA